MRIPYVANPPPTPTAEETSILARITARRHPRPLQPLDLALLHSPPLADGWNAFLGAVRTRSSLSPILRELAICRVAVCNQAWYEWAHHAPLLIAAGMGAEVVEGVVKVRDLGEEEKGGLGEREWAVLRFADEMTRCVKVRDETFEALRRVCGEREIVEVTATVSFFFIFFITFSGRGFLLLQVLFSIIKANSLSSHLLFIYLVNIGRLDK